MRGESFYFYSWHPVGPAVPTQPDARTFAVPLGDVDRMTRALRRARRYVSRYVGRVPRSGTDPWTVVGDGSSLRVTGPFAMLHINTYPPEELSSDVGRVQLHAEIEYQHLKYLIEGGRECHFLG